MSTTPPVILNPIVGKFYKVRCARIKAGSDRHPMADRDGWVPILGPEHHDREIIGFQGMHFHVDARFLSDGVMVMCVRGGRNDGDVLAQPLSTYSDGMGHRGQPTKPLAIEFATRRRRCHREMPEFPNADYVSFGRLLEEGYACTKLKPGLVCPHRGIDLRPFVKPDGTAICPGHGLKWNTHTGDLIRRYPVTPIAKAAT